MLLALIQGWAPASARPGRVHALLAPLVLILAVLGCGSGSGETQRDALRLTSPSADGAANEARPTLTWRGLEGETRYRVVLRASTREGAVLEEQIVPTPEATMSVALAQGDVIHATVEALDRGGFAESRFVARLVPEDFPRYHVAAHDPARAQGGYVLFNIQDPLPPNQDGRIAALVLVNRSGEILWWLERDPGFVTDARVLPNGNLLFIDRPNEDEPRALETTWDGTVLWASRDGAYPHHEVGLGPDEGYLYLTSLLQDVDGEPWEGDGLELVDRRTGQVTWSWSIFDHLSTDERNLADLLLPGVSLRGGADWTHSNGAIWDPERRVIWVSVRNLDRMLAVSFPSGTVQATIGQSGLGGDDLMSHPHAPELQTDGSVVLFDNGNTRSPRESRVISFDWDEAAGTVSSRELWAPDPPIYDPAVGDADRLPNGNLLVASGTTNPLTQKPATLFEVTPGGDVVWQLETTDGFRLLGFWIYRAEHLSLRSIPPGIVPFVAAPTRDGG